MRYLNDSGKCGVYSRKNAPLLHASSKASILCFFTGIHFLRFSHHETYLVCRKALLLGPRGQVSSLKQFCCTVQVLGARMVVSTRDGDDGHFIPWQLGVFENCPEKSGMATEITVGNKVPNTFFPATNLAWSCRSSGRQKEIVNTH